MTDEYLEAVALGFYALRSKLSHDPHKGWQRLPDSERARYRAHARFVLSYADVTALQAGRLTAAPTGPDPRTDAAVGR